MLCRVDWSPASRLWVRSSALVILATPRLIDIGSNLRLSDLASKVKQVTAWVNLRKSQQKRSVTECGLWGPVT